MSSNIRENKTKDELVIDLPHIISVLFGRLWIIAMAAFLCAGIGFGYSTFALEPMYSSRAQMYVNNKSVGIAGITLGNSDLIASQGLVPLVIQFLTAYDTLDEINRKAELDISADELKSMLAVKQTADTQAFDIIVTSSDPYLSYRIAKTITETLPERMTSLMAEGVSVKIVDSARVNLRKVSPNITQYTAVGFLIGFLVACTALTVLAIMDDAIHDENYLIETFEFPLLAKIPDLYDNADSKYSYYSSSDKGEKEAGK